MGGERVNLHIPDTKPWLPLDEHAKNRTKIQIFGFSSGAKVNIRLSMGSIEMTFKDHLLIEMAF